MFWSKNTQTSVFSVATRPACGSIWMKSDAGSTRKWISSSSRPSTLIGSEFIGEADRVNDHMLRNCTDLRDRAQQGAGVPNLVKMLVNS